MMGRISTPAVFEKETRLRTSESEVHPNAPNDHFLSFVKTKEYEF